MTELAWIESHQDLAHHPKVARLANALGVSVPTAIGHLHCLWWWCLSYADDGDVSGFTSFEIAHGAQWSGDPDEFVEALADGWLDSSGGLLEVHDWWDYAGKLVERRKADADRKRQGRAKDILETSAGHPPDVRTDGVRTQPTQPNPTQQTEPKAAANEPFQVFHKQRARSEVKRRISTGRPVVSETGLVHTLEHAADFTEESKRIWNHATCKTCGGTGFESFTSPGSGGVDLQCRGVP